MTTENHTCSDILNKNNSIHIDSLDGEISDCDNKILEAEDENSDKIKAQKGTDKDNPDGQICVAADTAEADNKGNTAASATGKFKSVEALMSAYLSLEAEFTRRSQRLKELEESKMNEASSQKCIEKEELLAAALSNEDVRNAVVSEYLKTVTAGRSVPLMVGGTPCAAPKSDPKSIKEAGALAKQFLKY